MIIQHSPGHTPSNRMLQISHAVSSAPNDHDLYYLGIENKTLFGKILDFFLALCGAFISIL